MRETVAAVASPRLQRHEVDELFGAMTAAALTSDVAVLTGPEHERVMSSDVFRRLASDLRSNGVAVIGDLTGPALESALAGGLDLLKLSHEELGPLAEGPRLTEALLRGDRPVASARRRQRGDLPSRSTGAGEDRELLELRGPRFEPVDPHGTGDAMVAALAVGVAAGSSCRPCWPWA